MKRDFISDTYRITLYEEQLAELEELKINMIDAEEEEYSDDSLGQSIVGFVFICLINWFIFGPLLLAFGEADMNYEFLSPLANLGDLHWSLSLLYIFVNYGLCFFSGIMLLSTYSFLFAPSYGLFRRKLTAEQQKDKAIEAITLKIENLCREVKRKKYIKRFLDA